MPRPPKKAETKTSRIDKVDSATRTKVEDLFGANLEDGLKPSKRLNSNQKKLYNFIVDHFKKINVLGDIDTIMLETTVIAIDRLQSIEKMINEDFELIRDKSLLSAKDKYTKDFLKGVEKFGMSPIDRAKFGVLTVQAKETENDPLLKVLGKKSS